MDLPAARSYNNGKNMVLTMYAIQQKHTSAGTIEWSAINGIPINKKMKEHYDMNYAYRKYHHDGSDD